jgi:hypothetical protein
MSQDDRLAFLENEVHRLTELVRHYAEEANRARPLRVKESEGRQATRPHLSAEEMLFARDMAIAANDQPVRKRA